MKTQIRLQSDQGLHCLPQFCLISLDKQVFFSFESFDDKNIGKMAEYYY